MTGRPGPLSTKCRRSSLALNSPEMDAPAVAIAERGKGERQVRHDPKSRAPDVGMASCSPVARSKHSRQRNCGGSGPVSAMRSRSSSARIRSAPARSTSRRRWSASAAESEGRDGSGRWRRGSRWRSGRPPTCDRARAGAGRRGRDRWRSPMAHQAHPSAAAQERQPALDEQLIEVGVAVAVQPVDSHRVNAVSCRAPVVIPEHLHGIADHGVESQCLSASWDLRNSASSERTCGVAHRGALRPRARRRVPAAARCPRATVSIRSGPRRRQPADRETTRRTEIGGGAPRRQRRLAPGDRSNARSFSRICSSVSAGPSASVRDRRRIARRASSPACRTAEGRRRDGGACRAERAA